jgi:hypothetical protein
VPVAGILVWAAEGHAVGLWHPKPQAQNMAGDSDLEAGQWLKEFVPHDAFKVP